MAYPRDCAVRESSSPLDRGGLMPSSIPLYLLGSIDLLPILDNHVLIPDHHLHFRIDHKIMVIFTQRRTLLIIHKPSKAHPVSKHKRANRVIIQQLRFSFHDVLHYGAVALELVGERVADDVVFEEDGSRHLGVLRVVVGYEVGVREAGFLFYEDGGFYYFAHV